MAKMGAPTKYKKEFIAKVDEYLAKTQDEEYEFIKSESNTSTTKERKIRVKLPTREGFANFIGCCHKSLDNWSAEDNNFLRALEKIDNEQKKRLLENGLSGDYNPVIAKLVLSANHGMKEKTETDITTKGERIDGFNYIKPE